MKDILETVKSHRSIRKYKDIDIPKEDLEKILTPIVHVPTSVNGQQFSVIVVKDKERKDKIAQLTGNQKWISEAPVFLVFVADFSRISKVLEDSGVEFGNIDSVESSLVGAVDCGIAFGSVMNVAESMGYGIVPIGAIRKEPKDIIELLELPKYVYPIVGMCVGSPDEDPGLKPRFKESIVIHNETYKPIEKSEIEDYDKVVTDYMEKRTDGQDVRSWSDLVKRVYKNVYFPKVYPTMKEQGFKNEK